MTTAGITGAGAEAGAGVSFGVDADDGVCVDGGVEIVVGVVVSVPSLACAPTSFAAVSGATALAFASRSLLVGSGSVTFEEATSRNPKSPGSAGAKAMVRLTLECAASTGKAQGIAAQAPEIVAAPILSGVNARATGARLGPLLVTTTV